MKRAEIDAPNTPHVIRTRDIPKPSPGGVVVKTKFCGICHSDVHLAEGKFDIGGGRAIKTSDVPGLEGFKFPTVFGHEIAGVIHSLDNSVKSNDGLKVGDKVVVYPWMGCNNCPFCDNGDGNLCAKAMALGLGIDGGYSEYVPVSRRDFVVKVPDNMTLDIACMLACSGVTGYNALSKIKPTVESFVNVTGKANLLIIGAGGLGLWSLQTARAYLPKETRILCADIDLEKLKNAKAAGADDTVFWDPRKSEEKLIALTKSKGDIHAVIDFVNNSTTATRALACIAKGGAISLVGLFGGKTTISLPIYALSLHQLFGVYVGTLNQLKELVQLVASANLTPPALSYVPLTEVDNILGKLKRGEIKGRVLVKF